jgi:hypothetical protein
MVFQDARLSQTNQTFRNQTSGTNFPVSLS